MYYVSTKDFTGFLTMFLILFLTAGIGNGSTYRMIPSIFREEKRRTVRGLGEDARAAAMPFPMMTRGSLMTPSCYSAEWPQASRRPYTRASARLGAPDASVLLRR